MGALTLKVYPFELRGWEVRYRFGVDPTDSFGSTTRVFTFQRRVVQIQPDYDSLTGNFWISDKSRVFFDGLLGRMVWKDPKKAKFHEAGTRLNPEGMLAANPLNNEFRSHFIKFEQSVASALFYVIYRSVYLFDLMNSVSAKRFFSFFTVLFNNQSVESVAKLMEISKRFSFVKLRKLESDKTCNDSETDCQVNLDNHLNRTESHFESKKLSQLCLLIATTPRYESFYLNLNMRSNYLQGDFDCFVLGPLMDITFPVTFLGSNLDSLWSIFEGRSLTSPALTWSSHYPFTLFNKELLKRRDGKSVFSLQKFVKLARTTSFAIPQGVWHHSNCLSPSLQDTGTFILNKFEPVTTKDLSEFSILHSLNVSSQSLPEFKKIAALRWWNAQERTPRDVYRIFSDGDRGLYELRPVLEQSDKLTDSLSKWDISWTARNRRYIHLYLPVANFYQRQESFFNFEGYIRKTMRIISRDKDSYDNWRALRLIENQLAKVRFVSNRKDSDLIFYDDKASQVTFRDYLKLTYLAAHRIDSSRLFYFTGMNSPFAYLKNFYNFKGRSFKTFSSKIKYWLDDFFCDGRDDYSHDSFVLAKCSQSVQLHSTNFSFAI